jgi:predicted nucleic acid-binding protein
MANYLADTNILLYLVNPAAPEHAGSARSLERILAGGDRVVLAAQTFYEFWSVATRPAEVNGLGWSPERAATVIAAIRGRFPVLPEPPEVLDLWLDLVIRNSLRGKRIHDAHLLATMRANGVTKLLTLNAADFPATPGITVLTPEC